MGADGSCSPTNVQQVRATACFSRGFWLRAATRSKHSHRFPLVLARRFEKILSALADRYQCRTQAATQLLCSVAATAGGQSDACLAAQMQLPASRATLLHCLMRHATRPVGVPRVVGVDDFAWTKRRRYGTILVGLEKHQLLALLADCEVETVAAWSANIRACRSSHATIAQALLIRFDVDPPALHIANRFHLYMNAMTCLETLLAREQATLRRVAGALRTQHSQAHPRLPPKPLAPEQQRSERWARRYARYEQVVRLKAQSWSQRAIAQETGLHPQTVAISLKSGQFPERAPHPRCSRVIEPYLDYLQMRWEQRGHNGRLLFEEIRAQGYPAGLTEVYIAIQPWSTHGPTASLARAKEVQQYPSYSPKQTLWLLFKEKRTNQEQQFVQSLLEQSTLMAHTYESVRRFRQILMERDETALHS